MSTDRRASDPTTPHSQRSLKSFTPNPLTKYFRIILSVDAVQGLLLQKNSLKIKRSETLRWESEGENHDRDVEDTMMLLLFITQDGFILVTFNPFRKVSILV